MFDFEIVRNDDGTEVIDRTGCTFYDELSPSELIDYNEVDDQLYAMEIAERKLRRSVLWKWYSAVNDSLFFIISPYIWL